MITQQQGSLGRIVPNLTENSNTALRSRRFEISRDAIFSSRLTISFDTPTLPGDGSDVDVRS